MSKLAAVPAHAAQLSCMTGDVRQMEAVAQILLRKVDTESKYLARLEGKQLKLQVSHGRTSVLHAFLYPQHASAHLCVFALVYMDYP